MKRRRYVFPVTDKSSPSNLSMITGSKMYDWAENSSNTILEQDVASSSQDVPLSECRPTDEALTVAARGNLEEFSQLYKKNPECLDVQDPKGQRPLHTAIANGHKNIVDFIISKRGYLNATNGVGDTALHVAVRHDLPDVVEALLDAGADHSILNHQTMAPLHLACDLGHAQCVKTMMKNKGVDPNISGELGVKPLHYCSIRDHAECARILVKNSARQCMSCDMGYYPLHVAAKSAAANTMEVLIQQGMQAGYDRATLLSFKDKENNMPLHAAVNGGNIKAVEVCLKAGAPVNSQQDDKSTPIHFAATQGNLHMIQMMYDLQEDNFLAALNLTDVVKMTPLHRAALFNHKEVVLFLLQKGASINSQDLRGRTPLLLAASKDCWDTAQVLVEQGADVEVRDENQRSFLHLAIRFGGKLSHFFTQQQYADSEVDITDNAVDSQTETTKSTTPIRARRGRDLRYLLDEKDENGCTPLHYASKQGHLLAIDDLITLGAAPSLKDNEKKSPFHFAARYGRYNTCRRLLELPQGPNIINETDGNGLTGLHIAAQNGHNKIITLLLEKGAVIQKDNGNNSPLHHAASQGWTKSMKTLLAIHCNLLDMKNMRGETALHLAAQNGHVTAVSLLLTVGAAMEHDMEGKSFFDYVIEHKMAEVAMAVVKHDRWEEVLILCSTVYGCPFLGLIEHMPTICETVLDRCRKESNHEKRSEQLYIEYNFKFLNCPIQYITVAKKAGMYEPMMTLNAMVRHGRVNILSHPVCISYMRLKWHSYGQWLYLLLLSFYLLFLASITWFVVHHDSLVHHDSGTVDNKTLQILQGNHKKIDDMGRFSTCAVWMMTLFGVLSIVRALVLMISQKASYFNDVQWVFEWTLYVTSLLFATPFIMDFSFHWQWESGVLAIFFAWFNLLVFLQRFDFFGIYVVMFLEILRTLLKVLSVFSVLIVAFGLAFYMLLAKEGSKAYSTPGLSFIRTAMMMLELDYMASFNDPYTDGEDSTLHFGGLTLFMVCVFVVLMPNLLMNLLIGLAVGDIESVQRNARLKRLARQVELHTNIERRMPLFLLARFDQPVYRYFPNKCRSKMYNLWAKVVDTDREERTTRTCDIDTTILLDELGKQKQKVKEMGTMLEKNNQLLKLIVQKMEIQTEDDGWDEGLDYEKLNQEGKSLAIAKAPQTSHNANTAFRRMLSKTSIVIQMKNGWKGK